MAPRATLAVLLSLAPLLAGCTADPDADDDGLDDAAEGTPAELRIHTANGTQARDVTSDPRLADTDGDGLGDLEEREARTDPRDVDSDGDGLLDGRDLLLREGHPLFALLVARGIVRDPEDGRFLGEADAGTKPFDWDGDRPFPDGMPDGDELRGWNVSLADRTYAVRSDPNAPDTDGDGLGDLQERGRACDPTMPDADLDGATDPLDADCAHNLHVELQVTHLHLNRSLDPAGDTDLVLQVQAAGLLQTHAQPLRLGPNNVTFRWTVDVPDHGAPGRLVVPFALTFWDQDLAGDDDQSGVQRQAVRIAGERNVLAFDYDVFARRFALGDGTVEGGDASSRGEDGSVRFRLRPLLG